MDKGRGCRGRNPVGNSGCKGGFDVEIHQAPGILAQKEQIYMSLNHGSKE
ncbi:MAG: hypothetical protein MOIL_01328 [Candidatus Methanolliviera sp. GoM_oil]|nr:MAG: hypothetical protein MOIL_01328 [Candidatus Methanolliviera sp. GoM_oil]